MSPVLCSLLSFCRCRRTSRSGTLEKDLRSVLKRERSQEEEEEAKGGGEYHAELWTFLVLVEWTESVEFALYTAMFESDW